MWCGPSKQVSKLMRNTSTHSIAFYKYRSYYTCRSSARLTTIVTHDHTICTHDCHQCNTLPLDERSAKRDSVRRVPSHRRVLSLDERRVKVKRDSAWHVSPSCLSAGDVKVGQGEATLCLYVLSKCLRSTI